MSYHPLMPIDPTCQREWKHMRHQNPTRGPSSSPFHPFSLSKGEEQEALESGSERMEEEKIKESREGSKETTRSAPTPIQAHLLYMPIHGDFKNSLSFLEISSPKPNSQILLMARC